MEDGGPGDPALGGAGGVRASVRLDGRGPADLAPRAASLRRGRGARDASRGQTAPRDETASAAAAEVERLLVVAGRTAAPALRRLRRTGATGRAFGVARGRSRAALRGPGGDGAHAHGDGGGGREAFRAGWAPVALQASLRARQPIGSDGRVGRVAERR